MKTKKRQRKRARRRTFKGGSAEDIFNKITDMIKGLFVSIDKVFMSLIGSSPDAVFKQVKEDAKKKKTEAANKMSKSANGGGIRRQLRRTRRLKR